MLDNRPAKGKTKYKIHCRVIYKRDKAVFSTGMETTLNDWMLEDGQFIENKTQFNLVRNNKLKAIRDRLIQIYLQQKQASTPVTSQMIVDQFKGKQSVAANMTLVDFYAIYLNECRQKPNEFGEGVIEHYVKTQTHLFRFLKINNWEKIKLNELSCSFIERFEHYLVTTPNKQTGRAMKNNTATTYLRKLRACIGGAIRQEILKTNPFSGFKMRNFRWVHKEILTQEEVAQLKEFDPENLSLERVKDAFLMSCETGLRHSDLVRLHEDMIKVDSGGVYWIILIQKKTDDVVEIPMTDYAIHLYNKYQSFRKDSGGFVVPVLTNQKINSALKIIAKLIGFNRRLSFHCSRHTFATIALELGTDITTVAAWMGHRDIKSTLIYAKVTRRRKADALRTLNTAANKLKTVKISRSHKMANTAGEGYTVRGHLVGDHTKRAQPKREKLALS